MEFSLSMFWEDITYILKKVFDFIRSLFDKSSDDEGATE